MLWLAFLLAACSPGPEQAPHTSDTRTFRWVQSAAPCKDLIHDQLWTADACVDLRTEPPTVYAEAPKNADDRMALCRLGHEVAHLFYPDLHGTNEAKAC